MERKQRRYRIRWIKLLTALGLLTASVAVLVIGIKLFNGSAAEEAAKLAGANEEIASTPSPIPDASPQSVLPKAEGLLILVNWDNPVPYDRPENLVGLSEIFGDEVICVNPDGSIDAETGYAAKEMFLAAASEGIGKYKLASAYRSIEYQDKLWQARIDDDPSYGSNPYENPVKVVPGECSEHTTGLAIDILSECYGDSDEGYADTPEGIWLADNAYKFGFMLRYPKDKESITGVIFEPWHYRYVGKEAAGEIYNRGLCLEEYLERTHE